MAKRHTNDNRVDHFKKGELDDKVTGLTSEVHQSANRRTAGCRMMLKLKVCSHGSSLST